VVPADPHTEAQPPARQQVDVGSLPSDEGSLALREDQDPGDEADALGTAAGWANITNGS
jgi:hypothetical protein